MTHRSKSTAIVKDITSFRLGRIFAATTGGKIETPASGNLPRGDIVRAVEGLFLWPPFWPQIADSPLVFADIWRVIGSYLPPRAILWLSQVSRPFRAAFRDNFPVLTEEPRAPITLGTLFGLVEPYPPVIARSIMRCVLGSRKQPTVPSVALDIYPPLYLKCGFPACSVTIRREIVRRHMMLECDGRQFRPCTGGKFARTLALVADSNSAADFACSHLNKAILAAGMVANLKRSATSAFVVAFLSCARDGVTMKIAMRKPCVFPSVIAAKIIGYVARRRVWIYEGSYEHNYSCHFEQYARGEELDVSSVIVGGSELPNGMKKLGATVDRFIAENPV